MGKRLVALIVALALAAPFAAMADDTYYQPGNVVPSIGVGAGMGWGWVTLSVYPGVEVMYAKVKIADTIPLDFGVAAKGLVGLNGLGSGYFAIGAGVFATVHWGFRGMNWDLDFLDPVDLWWGIGLALNFFVPYGSPGWDHGGLFAFATAGGVNYFLTDRFALMFAGNYWGYGGGYVGILYKLDKGEKLVK